MKEFTYTIKDSLGIHARPAGLLVQEAKKYSSDITIQKGDKKGNLKQIFAVMGLGVKCGDSVTVTASGDDEDEASAGMEKIFKENL